MKTLPFETDTLRVDSRPCVRCKGAGAYAGGDCYTCRGWGRVTTAEGRRQLDAIAELVGGVPAYDEKHRFDAMLHQHIYGKHLRVGMNVCSARDWDRVYRIITDVSTSFIEFDNRTRIPVSELASFYREFTPAEIALASRWLALRVHSLDGTVTADT